MRAGANSIDQANRNPAAAQPPTRIRASQSGDPRQRPFCFCRPLLLKAWIKAVCLAGDKRLIAARRLLRTSNGSGSEAGFVLLFSMSPPCHLRCVFPRARGEAERGGESWPSVGPGRGRFFGKLFLR